MTVHMYFWCPAKQAVALGMSSSRQDEGWGWRSFQPPASESGAHDASRKRARPSDEDSVSSQTRKVLEEAHLVCRSQAAAVLREVSHQIYGKTFKAIAQFLGRSHSDVSQWGKLRALLESKSGPSSGSARAGACSGPPSSTGSRGRQEHGGFECLIPCAILHPNMSPGDRSLLIHLLLNSLRKGPSSSDMTVVTVRARLHSSLPKIFSAMHDALAADLRTTRTKPSVSTGGGGWQPPRRLLGPTSFQDVLSLHASLPASSRRKRVLLVFEDVEALDTRLLESLLCLLGEAALDMPLQIVFLVSSSCAFSADLSTSATSVLEASTFTLPPARTCFEKVLERLFLRCELPVTVSAHVLRFLRTSFADSHCSITVFFRHLDFLLHRHFQSPTAILAMLPYLQRSADSSDGRGSHHASASRLDRVLLSPGPEGGDEEGVSEEERGLAIDPDFPWQTTYKEYVYDHLGELLELGSLQAIASMTSGHDDLTVNFRLLQKAVKDQVVRRFEIWTAVQMVHKAVRVLKQGGDSGSSGGPLDVFQAMLLTDCPAAWEAMGTRLKDGIADTSLRELEQLVLQWDWFLTDTVLRETDEEEEEDASPADKKAGKKRRKKQGNSSQKGEPAASPPVPKYVCTGSSVLRRWCDRVKALVSLIQALAKDTRQWDRQETASKAKARETKAAMPQQAKQGFQSRRMALAAQGMHGGGGEKGVEEEQQDEEVGGEEAALMEQRQREFRIKERGVRNAVIELFIDVTEQCIGVARAPSAAHEAVWCYDTQALESAFFAQVRAAAVRKLSDPQSHLRCTCCEPGDVNASMPDRCIVYNLYEEDTRRTVGLSSLYEPFADLVTADSGRNAGSKEQEERLRLRLQHGINELEQLGFLRPWGSRGEWIKMVYSYTCLKSTEGAEEGLEQQA